MEYLVYYRIEGSDSIECRLMSDTGLIKLYDEIDFDPVEVIKILNITDPENIFEIEYAGWKPGCLIEFKDKEGKTVLSGYGTDH